jgi:penicillin-binding protein 1A
MENTPEQEKKYAKILWWLGMSPWIFFTLVLGAVLLSGLPNIDLLANPKIGLASQIYASDGSTLGSFYKENRSDITYQEIPGHVIDALLATEDVRFKEHSGIDVRSLARAAVSLGADGGGSTITQQLAKLQFTRDFEDVGIFTRIGQKLQEWVIALRLERVYTKEEILTMYLNQYDFLNQAVGLKSAANIYFSTSPDSLTVPQGAMLVGMLKNSSLFNPIKRDSLVTKRREVVLAQMMKYGKLSEDDYEKYRTEPLGLKYARVSHDEGQAPYFREAVRQKLTEILETRDANGELKYKKGDGSAFNIYEDGLKVYTTLDKNMQIHAEHAVEEHLSKELQPAFTRNVRQRPKDKYPFYSGITAADKESIMRKAITTSDRYKKLSGKMCPDCGRPSNYIETTNGHFHCKEDAGGCGHTWNMRTEDEVLAEFNKPVSMTIYKHGGYRDTTMTPYDSIVYHKTILHASLMSVDPRNGFVKAWVGGIDYKYFKFDNVFLSKRQVGSTFKPFIYAMAMRMGMKPCDQITGAGCIDLPNGGRWCPKGGAGGTYTMARALAGSVNSIAATLIARFGPEPVIAMMRHMGVKSYIPMAYSIALGACELSVYELVGAQASLVNHGLYIEPTFIMRVEDKNGNLIYEADPVIDQAIEPGIAYETVKLMKGVCDFGTASRIRSNPKYGKIPYPMAGKTGTTQNNTDGWFIGMTPELVTGVWVGAQDPTVRFSSTGLGQGANTGLPIFGYYMNGIYKDPRISISKGDFEVPTEYDPLRFECTSGGMGDLFYEGDDASMEEFFNGELEFDGDVPE